MAEQPLSFEELIAAARGGCDRAVRELLDSYGNHILRAIRRRLHSRMRSQFDSSDFEQAVWASFFAMDAERAPVRTPDEMASFLAALAGHKVADEFRRRMTSAKRNLNREKSLESVGGCDGALPGSGETPSQAAMADECWDQMADGQAIEVRQMLAMLRDGYSHQEIAQRTGLHLKAIQRIIRGLRQEIAS